MTLEKIVAALHDRRNDVVAEKTGLAKETIGAIRRGQNDNPTHKTLVLLSDYLEGKTK